MCFFSPSRCCSISSVQCQCTCFFSGGVQSLLWLSQGKKNLSSAPFLVFRRGSPYFSMQPCLGPATAFFLSWGGLLSLQITCGQPDGRALVPACLSSYTTLSPDPNFFEAGGSDPPRTAYVRRPVQGPPPLWAGPFHCLSFGPSGWAVSW